MCVSGFVMNVDCLRVLGVWGLRLQNINQYPIPYNDLLSFNSFNIT